MYIVFTNFRFSFVSNVNYVPIFSEKHNIKFWQNSTMACDNLCLPVDRLYKMLKTFFFKTRALIVSICRQCKQYSHIFWLRIRI